MKRITLLYLCTSFFTLSFYSCSNDEFDGLVNPDTQIRASLEINNDSVPVIGSYEDWFIIFGVESEKDSALQNNLRVVGDPWAGLRPGDRPISLNPGNDEIQEKTVTGYTSLTKMSTQRVMFNADMAKLLGLSTGRVYHTHIRVVQKSIVIPNGYDFFEDNSPNCGFTPTGQGTLFTKRGYTFGSVSTNMTLTTHIYFVEVDEMVGNINIEFPCTSAQLVWKYTLWKNN